MKAYFYRVRLCMKKDFSRGVLGVRFMNHLADLLDSFLSVICGVVAGLFSVSMLFIQPLGMLLSAFYMPIKHGANIEQKLAQGKGVSDD